MMARVMGTPLELMLASFGLVLGHRAPGRCASTTCDLASAGALRVDGV